MARELVATAVSLWLAVTAIAGERSATALDHLKAGRYEQALPLLEAELAAADEHEAAGTRYYLGFCLLGLYRFGEAEAHLRAATAASPRQAEWLQALAKALLDQGRHLEAIAVLDRAIAIEPKPSFLFARAIAAMNAGRYDASESDLRATLALLPRHAEALFWLGKLSADRGDDEAALALLRRCLEADPDHLEARFRKGLAERKSGDAAAALADFSAVVAIVPGHVGALYNLAQVLHELGRRDDAGRRMAEFRAASALEDRLRFHEEMVKLDPDDADKRLALAALQLDAGRNQAALETLGAARTLAPGRPEVYRSLSTALDRLGQRADAERARAFARRLETAP